MVPSCRLQLTAFIGMEASTLLSDIPSRYKPMQAIRVNRYEAWQTHLAYNKWKEKLQEEAGNMIDFPGFDIEWSEAKRRYRPSASLPRAIPNRVTHQVSGDIGATGPSGVWGRLQESLDPRKVKRGLTREEQADLRKRQRPCWGPGQRKHLQKGN